jgi:hypothetical protein
LILGAATALAAAEIVLRATGRPPWKETVYASDMPLMHEPDGELGWRNKPGEYVFGTPEVRMTFWPDHTRATAPRSVGTAPSVLVIGDSFVQGWAVSDQETFAWKLQERFPHAAVRNLGCAGYGTTQSLLALERYLGEDGAKPEVVVYGFSDFHEGRNVATASWLKNLAQLAQRGHVSTPYASLGKDGALELHPPARYPAWPLHRELATVALLEERWAELATAARASQAIAVTENLLLELDHVVGQSGATLLVAFLSELERDGLVPYRTVLAARGIATAQCVHPGVWAPAMQVPVYGHPNAAINAFWAKCIGDALVTAAPDLADDADLPMGNAGRTSR